MKLPEIIATIKKDFPFEYEDIIRDDGNRWFKPEIRLTFSSGKSTFFIAHRWRSQRTDLIVFRNRFISPEKPKEIYTEFYSSHNITTKKSLERILKILKSKRMNIPFK